MTPYRTALLALTLWPASLAAQDITAGEDLYRHHCATCHGIEGRGNGPMAAALVLQPPNLRNLTTRHGGTFPTFRVVTRIDGRDPLVAHGSPMPVYGDFFEGNDTALKAQTGQPIMTSRAIADLVAFLEAVQE